MDVMRSTKVVDKYSQGGKMMRKIVLSLMLCGAFMLTACGGTAAEVPAETVEESTEETASEDILLEETGETALEEDTEETAERMGHYELEECRDPGIYVLMPDGSFEPYWSGDVLYWSHDAMTYGTESYPDSLIMDENQYHANNENLKKGELVLFCSEDYLAMNGMFPVTESGRALSSYDAGKITVLLMQNSIDYNDHIVFDSWEIDSEGCKWVETQIETIDGILLEDSKDTYSVEEKRWHVDIPEDTIFKMGISEGTTLHEKEFRADYMYFLQEASLGYRGSEDKYEFKLRSTVDGYAVFDFSDIPAGDYILNVSWWSEETRGRRVIPTFIRIE